MQSAAMAANKHLHTAMRLLTAKRTYCLVGFPGNCPLAQLFPSGHSMSALPRNSIDSGGQPGTKGPPSEETRCRFWCQFVLEFGTGLCELVRCGNKPNYRDIRYLFGDIQEVQDGAKSLKRT
jgi:hypothetical protein